MISDITLGQYFPGKSLLHRTDPRLKICLVIYGIVLLFVAGNFGSLAVAVATFWRAWPLSNLPGAVPEGPKAHPVPGGVHRRAEHLLRHRGPPVAVGLFEDYPQRHFELRVHLGAHHGPDSGQLGAHLHHLSHPAHRRHRAALKPLSKLRVPVHEFAMMMTIALRFVPTLLEETDKIMAAQKARGATWRAAAWCSASGPGAGAYPPVHLRLPPGL